LVGQGGAEGPSRNGVPEASCMVIAARQDRLAVGTEGHSVDAVAVPEGCPSWLSGGYFPDPGRVIRTPGDDALAVGAEGSGPSDGLVLQRQRTKGHSRGRVPEPGGMVLTGCHDGAVVGAEDGAMDGFSMLEGAADRGPCGRVPDPGRPVRTGRQDLAGVGAEHGRINPRCMLKGAAGWFPRSRVPEPRATLPVSRQNLLSIRAEAH